MEASYQNYMDLIKNTDLQDAEEITLEDGRSVKYKISEDQEGVIASADARRWAIAWPWELRKLYLPT